MKVIILIMIATFLNTGCGSGRRSKIAAEKLVSIGLTVTELDGGIMTWEGEIIK